MGDPGDDAEIVGDQEHAEAEIALELGEQAQDLSLHRDVERRGRLVGDQQLGFAHQRHGDHHPLAQAARELVRELAEPQARRGDADAGQQIGRAIGGGLLAGAPMTAQHLGHLRAHRVGGIEAGHRLLEDHGHGVAAQTRHALVGEALQVPAFEGEPPGPAAGAPRQEVHHRQRRHRLAAAGFAHQAVGLAAFDGERGAAYRRGAAAEAHFELLDLQQRAHGSVLAPNRSRRPSPKRLTPSTSTNNATPGITITQGLKNM